MNIDEDRERANKQIDTYLESYYGAPAKGLRQTMASVGGPLEDIVTWLRGYVRNGAEHLVLRFVGDHARQLEQIAAVRGELTR